MDKWVVRFAGAEFLVIVLLSVWLWGAMRGPENVRQAEREYAQARVVYDTVRTIRVNAADNYSRARRTLKVADTIQVLRVLALADTVIATDERALAAADTALARADDVIRALKAKKPKLIQPWAEALWNPYTREYVGRLGVDVRTIKNLSLVAAVEARASGPGVLLGARVTF